MAKKNQWLIEQYKQLEQQKNRLKKATETNIPEIYACFAKVLMEDYHHTPAYIEKLFARTQDVWHEMVLNDEVETMVDWCEQCTGIDLRMEK